MYGQDREELSCLAAALGPGETLMEPGEGPVEPGEAPVEPVEAPVQWSLC